MLELPVREVLFLLLEEGLSVREVLFETSLPVREVLFGLFEEGDAVIGYEVSQVVLVVVIIMLNL